MKTKSKTMGMHWTEMDGLLSGLLEDVQDGDANLEAIDKIVKIARARQGSWNQKIRYATARNEKPEIAALN